MVIVKIVATRCHILRLKCAKFDFGWGFALDPIGGAYSTPRPPSWILGVYFLVEGGKGKSRERVGENLAPPKVLSGLIPVVTKLPQITLDSLSFGIDCWNLVSWSQICCLCWPSGGWWRPVSLWCGWWAAAAGRPRRRHTEWVAAWTVITQPRRSVHLALHCYSNTNSGLECCNNCVCLSVHEHISECRCPIFTKFFVHLTYYRGSVLLWRHAAAAAAAAGGGGAGGTTTTAV